ncbi:unnamed protein product [Lactuca saligna]|uniref:N-acetyltransferase domain-containing protein n=1 Tax=Lactuca saligna TaxID=75948 RepID=A0AA35V9C0_LACSI|nr:unnamed protein product [Lactuca saligna]
MSSSLELSIRPFRVTDADDFFSWATDNRVTQYLRWNTMKDREEALKYLKKVVIPHPWRRSICFDDKSIGYISIKPESGVDRHRAHISYAIGVDFWGRGITTATMKMAIPMVFQEMSYVVRIAALVEDENKASQKVLGKLGFKKEVTMAETKITFIRDLDNMNDDYTVKVSIIRLWKSLSDGNPTIVRSIEMILMDEMSTKIRASVYPRDFQRFESRLKEDQAVYIRSPTIAPNKYTFKISDVTSKLNFHRRTTVNECLHFQSKTKYGFSFVSFETIISATATSNESIDIIGEVVSLGKLDSRDVSKSLHRLPLQIRNLE